MNPRRLLPLLAAAGTLMAAAPAQAQPYPSRPIKLIVSQAPGAQNDALARGLVEEMAKSLKQTVVVENKPGANGSIAAQYLLSQPADGYTLFLLGVSNMSWNPYLYKNLGHVPTRDFSGVAMVAESAFVTAVSTSFGARSLDELVKKVKAEPGKFSYASGGIGNSTHLSTELLMARTGLQLVHVPFANVSNLVVSVVSGETPLVTATAGSLLPLIKSGKMLALAVTGDRRLPALPEVPTFKELGVDLAVPGWYAIVARSGTPAEVVKRLNLEVAKALETPALKQLLAAQVLDAVVADPSEVERRARRDAEAWAPLIHKLGIAQ